jgi:hypothetical protein
MVPSAPLQRASGDRYCRLFLRTFYCSLGAWPADAETQISNGTRNVGRILPQPLP